MRKGEANSYRPRVAICGSHEDIVIGSAYQYINASPAEALNRAAAARNLIGELAPNLLPQ